MAEREVSYVWVDDSQGLRAAVESISSATRLGVDTEADSRHHYPEKTCLIQIVADERVFVIDPLTDIDIGELRESFENSNVEKIFHGADFDLRGLNRDWGFELQGVYDTNTGARFAGLERFGYAALIEDLVGPIIAKDQRLQRSDWSKRPLTEAALEYAAADVIYLGDVRDAIDERVVKLGRSGWVAEEMERLEQIRYTFPDPDSAYLGVRGSHKLNGRGLAVLKQLWELRETEARRRDRPTAFVIPAEALIAIATEPEIDLADVKGLGQQTRYRQGEAIARAVKMGLAADPLKRPPGRTPFRSRLSTEESGRLTKLKEWRIAEGKKLSMDPSLLWPMRSLERLSHEPSLLDEELKSPEIRRWQRSEFEAAVRATLA